MCRLLASTGGGDRELFERMLGLSHYHRDGWGAAWWSSTTQGYVRGDQPAYRRDSGFRRVATTLSRLHPATFVSHVRKRSMAPPLVGNSHPFVRDGWAFAHNGTLPWLETPTITDSERFFDTELVPGLRAGDDPVDVLGSALERVPQTYTALNCVLTDGVRLVAMEAHLTNPDYYALRWHADSKGVFVASAGIAPDEWDVLGNGNLLVVDEGVRVVNVSSKLRRLTA
jgi:predicted glutamine amidotransferase